MRKTGHAIKIKEMQAEIKRLEDERERIKKLDSLHDIAYRAIAMAEEESWAELQKRLEGMME